MRFPHGRRCLSGKTANTLYSVVLLLMLYDWPHQIYRNLGPRMPAATGRERLIVTAVDVDARRLHLRLTPTFVIGSAPASAGSFSGNAVIVISPSMLDPQQYSNNDVRFILAHEVGHIARLDAYRFWTRWTRGGAATREIDADRIAVRLVGCGAMRETVMHHWSNFILGYHEQGDYHPHPSTRLRDACGDFAGENERPALRSFGFLFGSDWLKAEAEGLKAGNAITDLE